MEKPLKELPWNQQIIKADYMHTNRTIVSTKMKIDMDLEELK